MPGCNVENAAYPVGTCAEAGAIAAMVAAGGDRDIRGDRSCSARAGSW
jgi:cytidine deaminase